MGTRVKDDLLNPPPKSSHEVQLPKLETHPESPPVTALSSFGGPNGRIEEEQKSSKKTLDIYRIYVIA